MYGVICFPQWREENKINLYVFEDLGLANLVFIEFHNNSFVPRGYWPAKTNFDDCAFDSNAKNKHNSYGYRMCVDINKKSRMMTSQRGTFSLNFDRYHFPKSAIINAGTDHCRLKSVLLSLTDDLMKILSFHYNLIYPELETKICDCCHCVYKFFDNEKEPWNLLDPLDRPNSYEVVSINDVKKRQLMPLKKFEKDISRLKSSEIFLLWAEENKTLYLSNGSTSDLYKPGMIICSDCSAVGDFLLNIWNPEKSNEYDLHEDEHERDRGEGRGRGRGRY